MSIRPVKRIIESRPAVEGAGVKLRRAFGFGNTDEFDPFLLFDDSPGIRIAVSRRSRTCSPDRSPTGTASATAARSAPAMFSG
jgi:hypothetical protein